MNINPTQTIKIVIDPDELSEAFPSYVFPFYLKRNLKDVSKKEGIRYIVSEIVAQLRSDPELKKSVHLTSKAIKSCGIYKIRIKKENNRGKSAGYRVIFLLITPLEVGYVLDITDHSIQDDLTNEQKKFCNILVCDLDQELRKILKQ